MKTQNNVISVLALVGLFVACNAGPHNKQSESRDDKAIMITSAPPPQSPNAEIANSRQESDKTSDSAAGTYLSSSAAIQRGRDTSRRFVRTANLHFKVKNVIKATYTIEDITNHFGGIVTYTHLQSTVNNTTTIPVSADSSLETLYFTMVNTITLRVPVAKLDTTLKCIAPLVDFLDYRTIKTDNVSFDIFSNLLEQQRMFRHNARLSKDVDNTKAKKLSDVTDAEDNITASEADADNIKVDIFRREDSIEYSVVTMYIYQRQSFKRVLIPNDKNISAYEPSFGHKLVTAIKYGWSSLLSLILGLIEIWWVLILLGLIFYLVYHKWIKRLRE